jgi:hypothetical protein
MIYRVVRPQSPEARNATHRYLTRLKLRITVDGFTTLIAFVLLISGIAYISGAPQAGSIEAVEPSWLLHLWGVWLCVSAPITLLGVFTGRAPIFSAGLWLMAGVFVVRAIPLFVLRPPGAILGACISLAVAAACILRARAREYRWPGSPWT